MIYDVIVAGAGLSGLKTAEIASKHGLEVLVLEKHKELSPVCAGGIGRPKLEEYDIEIPGYLVESRIQKFEAVTKDRKIEKNAEYFGYEDLGVVVERSKVDEYFRDRAEDAGADILMNTPVEEVQDRWIVNGEFKSNYLVCADGAFSKVAQMVGIDVSMNEDIYTSYQEVLDFDRGSSVRLIFDDRFCKSGYFWEFPVGDKTRIGLGESVELKENLKERTERYKRHRGIEKDPVETEGAMLDLGPPKRSVYKNLALVGDATGLCDPLMGGGNAEAIYSGRILGEYLGEDLAEYEKRLKPIKRQVAVRYAMKQWVKEYFNFNFARAINEMIDHFGGTGSVSGDIGKMILGFGIRELTRFLNLLKRIALNYVKYL